MPSLTAFDASCLRLAEALKPKPTPDNLPAPQPGPQTEFLNATADIVIYGGAAGGGKTFGLLLEAAKHRGVKGFGAVIFRRTYPQIVQQGGMWDESMNLYPSTGGDPLLGRMMWRWPTGARVSFAHMNAESDKLNYQGAQIAMIGWDQLEHFTESMFFYMLSRNRSTCGVKPYVRATCNPDVNSWLATFLAWWIDPETGFPLPERAGVVRYFVRRGELIAWADTAEELQALHSDIDQRFVKSLTFIPARVTDNAILMAKDPSYMANLMALSLVDRGRLLDGNWKIKADAGKIFNRTWFRIVPAAPADAAGRVRYWDKAATSGGGDWSVGLLMSRTPGGRFVVEDVVRGQWSSDQRNRVMAQTAALDKQRPGPAVRTVVEREPGSSGKESAEATVRLLAGYPVSVDLPSGSKEVRAQPLSAQAEAGNVDLVAGPWNEAYLEELQLFPIGNHDDQVDGSSGAFIHLTTKRGNFFDHLAAQYGEADGSGGADG